MRNRIFDESVRCAVIVGAFMLLGKPALCQSATPGFVDLTAARDNPFGIQGQKLSYLGTDGTPNQRGIAVSETISGGGSRAGYTLKHRGVIPNTLRLSVRPLTLRPN